jgi:hypothetical protein
MVIDKNIYYHTQKVTIANGTAAGLKSIPITVPDAFTKVIGIGVAAINNGGDANYRVGFRKTGQDLINAVHNSFFQIDTSVAPKEKLLPTNFDFETGSRKQIVIETNVALQADFEIDLIFKCIDPNKECDVRNSYPVAENAATSFPANPTTQRPH